MPFLPIFAAGSSQSGVVSTTFGFTTTAAGVPKVSGAVVSNFGGAFLGAGNDRQFGQAVSSFGGTFTVAGTVSATQGQVTSSFGGTFAVAGVDRAVGQVASSFGGAMLGAGNDRQFGSAVSSFGFTTTTVGRPRKLGQAVSSFGGAFLGAGNDRQFGQVLSSFGGTISVSGSANQTVTGLVSSTFGGTFTTKNSQLAAGVRAGVGTVGFLGNPAALRTLNYGDSFVGTVFEGTATNWSDGIVLNIKGDDLVVEGYHFNGVALLQHTGVNLTIKHCIVDNIPSSAFEGIGQNNGPARGLLTIEDTTINCLSGPALARVGVGLATDNRLIARRLDISGAGDSIHTCGYQGTDFASGSIISQCYLHNGAFLDASQHADFIQIYNAMSTYTSDLGQTYLNIEHCATDITTAPDGTPYSSCITMGHPNGTFTGPWLSAKVDNNLIPCGLSHLRVQYRQNNTVVTNNNFGFRNTGEFFLSTVEPQLTIDTLTWSNNIDGNGNPYNYNDAGPAAGAVNVTSSFGFTTTAVGRPRVVGIVSASFGFVSIAAGSKSVKGQAASSFGGAFLGAGNDRQFGQVVSAFGFTTTAAGKCKVFGAVSSSFGFVTVGASKTIVRGQVTAVFGGTFTAAGSLEEVQLYYASGGVFVLLVTSAAVGGVWNGAGQKSASGGVWV